VDLERTLREEVERLWGHLEVLVPLLLRPRRRWMARLVSFLQGMVF